MNRESAEETIKAVMAKMAESISQAKGLSVEVESSISEWWNEPGELGGFIRVESDADTYRDVLWMVSVRCPNYPDDWDSYDELDDPREFEEMIHCECSFEEGMCCHFCIESPEMIYFDPYEWTIRAFSMVDSIAIRDWEERGLAGKGEVCCGEGVGMYRITIDLPWEAMDAVLFLRKGE